jgi:hypothetical protein
MKCGAVGKTSIALFGFRNRGRPDIRVTHYLAFNGMLSIIAHYIE